MNSIKQKFEKIGAKIEIGSFSGGRNRRIVNSENSEIPILIDIKTENNAEIFDLRINKQFKESLDLQVLECKPKDRHLVLLAKELDKYGNTLKTSHFLCGHDERHWFVAGVKPCSTVDEAKKLLKPDSLIEKEVGKGGRKKNKHKTQNFVRQGEWYFIPTLDLKVDEALIRKNEPLRRNTRSKAHVAQFAYRIGGEDVYVSGSKILTPEEYQKLAAEKPEKVKWGWQLMKRNPKVYVKGTIKHPDHMTRVLNDWHEVLMNQEVSSNKVVFLD